MGGFPNTGVATDCRRDTGRTGLTAPKPDTGVVALDPPRLVEFSEVAYGVLRDGLGAFMPPPTPWPLLPRRPFPAPELRPAVPPFFGVASAPPFFSGGQHVIRIAGRSLGGNTARRRAPPAPGHGAPQLHGAELRRDHLRDSDGVS